MGSVNRAESIKQAWEDLRVEVSRCDRLGVEPGITWLKLYNKLKMFEQMKTESKTYTVSYGWGDSRQFDSFDLAFEFWDEVCKRDGTIYGDDGYDCDSDEGGFFVCNDGLTDEQRDRMHE